MREKLPFSFIKDLFPRYEPFGHKPEKATQKGYQHKHNPTWKPAKAAMSPAAWSRKRRAERLAKSKG